MKVTIRFVEGNYPATIGTHVLTGRENNTLKVRGTLMRYETTKTPLEVVVAFAAAGFDLSEFASFTFGEG